MEDFFTAVSEIFCAVSHSSPVYHSCQGSTEVLQKCLLLSEVFILPRHKVNHNFCPISTVLFADSMHTDVRDSVYIMREQNEGTRDSFPETVQRSVLYIYV